MRQTKILVGAVALLAATSLVVGGTYAYFNDPEVTGDQSVAAGTLDLDVFQRANVPANVNLANLAPGATGEFHWALENKGSLPGNLSLQVALTQNAENSCNEPEDAAEVGDGCGPAGELADAVTLLIYDDHSFTPDWTGTLQALHNETTLAGVRHPFFQLTAGDTRLLVVQYRIPTSAGNEIQSDSTTFHIDLRLDQQVPPGPPSA